MNLVQLSNKITDKNTIHSYLPLYETLLEPIKDTSGNILEIGVYLGGSIKLWYDYFTKATIYGCDIQDRVKIHKLKTYNRVLLNLNENAYTKEYVQKNFENKKFDFLIDDGPHSLESQEKFIELYSPLLSENGILIIEDVQSINWLEKLKNKTPEHLKQYIKTYDLRKNKGRYDDIVFTIDKVVRKENNETIIGLLPCAGTASRLHGLPKFMLPLKNTKGCLLTQWINILLLNECSKIIIGASNNTIEFIKYIVKNNFDNIKDTIFIKLVGNTKTMNETIIKCLEDEIFNFVIMGMPDTVVENISTKMIKMSDIDVGVNLWNIRETQIGKIGQCKIDDNFVIDIIDKNKECEYNYGWGVVVFKQPFMKYMLIEDLHTGYSMQRFLSDNNKITYEIVNGLYFDCGTMDGYKEYLNYMECITPTYIKGTIIIMAVYINNTEKSYNNLIECLNQLRKIYPNEFIVAVDNGSLNDKWHQVAKESNIIILKNTSTMHKYEIGAYKFALQYFRADNYICKKEFHLTNDDLSLLENN